MRPSETQRCGLFPSTVRTPNVSCQAPEENQILPKTQLTVPLLAVDGEKSFGATPAAVMRNVATDVREAVVPVAGHWLIEEGPAFTISLI